MTARRNLARRVTRAVRHWATHDEYGRVPGGDLAVAWGIIVLAALLGFAR